MTESERVVIIGVSGASSSGKTTVSKLLKHLLTNSTLLHEDDFYKPVDQIPMNTEFNELNWDTPEAIDFKKLSQTLSNYRTTKGYQFEHVSNESQDMNMNLSEDLIDKITKKLTNKIKGIKFVLLDGFLLYHNEELMKLMDIKLFFKTNYETLKQRRNEREYIIDAGVVWTDPPNYFENLVWTEYYNNHKQLFHMQDEESIKLNKNATLNEHSINDLNIKSFDNDNNSSFDELFNDVIDTILKEL